MEWIDETWLWSCLFQNHLFRYFSPPDTGELKVLTLDIDFLQNRVTQWVSCCGHLLCSSIFLIVWSRNLELIPTETEINLLGCWAGLVCMHTLILGDPWGCPPDTSVCPSASGFPGQVNKTRPILTGLQICIMVSAILWFLIYLLKLFKTSDWVSLHSHQPWALRKLVFPRSYSLLDSVFLWSDYLIFQVISFTWAPLG